MIAFRHDAAIFQERLISGGKFHVWQFRNYGDSAIGDASWKMIAERKRQDETLAGTPRGVPGQRDGKDVRLGRWLLCAARRRGLCHAPRRDVRKAKELRATRTRGRGTEKHGQLSRHFAPRMRPIWPRAADACMYARHCKITASKTITLQPNSSRNPTTGQWR